MNAAKKIKITTKPIGAKTWAGTTTFYRQGVGDGCYAITVSGAKKLFFMNATSGSTAATTTRIQFVMPGNGMINFGTGGKMYEFCISLLLTKKFGISAVMA